jgi:phage shock protein C
MTTPDSSQQTRRIYRSRTDRILGGVAGGLANYLGVDPVLIRLAFVALLFAGIGVLLYIVAWIIIPEEPIDGSEDAPPPRTRNLSSSSPRAE